MLRGLVVFGLFCLPLCAEQPVRWTVGRSPHFTIYSESAGDDARTALLWFERLRAFFVAHTDFKIDDSRRVFIIAFRSTQDYAPYRLHENVDAFYVGEEGRDYIVLPSLSPNNYGLAAHEYAHLAFHSAGLHLPFWFGEGLAEYLSTIRVGERQSGVGGDLPARIQILAHKTWIPFPTLLAAPLGSTFGLREQADLFYSESWLLVDMLVRSPAYAAAFPILLKSLTSGTPSEQALTKIYVRPIEVIAADLRNWAAARATSAISLSGVPLGDMPIQLTGAPPSTPRAVIAQLLLASGDLGRAQTLYRELDRGDPKDGDVLAALASIALLNKDPALAHTEWQRAMKAGVTDAALCVRYASTADSAGVDPDEIRQALGQAILLDPTLDDCRYRLAIAEHNAGRWADAIAQLRAMRTVAPQREFSYWITMASALENLDRREETMVAARHALAYSGSAYDRTLARQMIVVAQTDLNVQFTRDANGNEEIETTRIPHDSKNWNPFIEPGETVRHAEGTLDRVECAGILTGLVVNTAGGELTLRVPDPHRVQLKNAPTELTCGGEQSTHVKVEYVVPGAILKGLEFVR
ncbi:MAG TPA: tetratricopeptide repeat protein [Bryobacteraceae bacterium]|jgi:tetratricopeptide (TPR) repeat protein|nr:tetratricopeptide repeat protein [Bryobacteraceae bacterium]